MTTTPDTQPAVVRADNVPGPPQGSWTYDAYAQIPDDGRHYEIVDGVLYMAPASGFDHQNAVSNFGAYLKLHIQFAGLGIALVAPFDVELLPGGNVVQPDVIVILNAHREILTSTRAVGVPDLVVEVASPSTATYDRRTKMDAYARAGVPQYWLADPHAQTVELLSLEADGYRSLGIFHGQATLPSRVLPSLPVRVEQYFAM